MPDSTAHLAGVARLGAVREVSVARAEPQFAASRFAALLGRLRRPRAGDRAPRSSRDELAGVQALVDAELAAGGLPAAGDPAATMPVFDAATWARRAPAYARGDARGLIAAIAEVAGPLDGRLVVQVGVYERRLMMRAHLRGGRTGLSNRLRGLVDDGLLVEDVDRRYVLMLPRARRQVP